MRIKGATLAGAGVSALVGIGVPIAFPDVQPWVGYCLLAFAACLAFLSLGMALPRWMGGGEAGVSSETVGTKIAGDSFGSTSADTYHVHGAPNANTFGRVDQVTIGERKLELTSDVIDGIEAAIRQDGSSKVAVEGVGPPASQRVASELADQLRLRGLEVEDGVATVYEKWPSNERPIEIAPRKNLAGQLDGTLIISVDMRVTV
jgi:hypothetical protein